MTQSSWNSVSLSIGNSTGSRSAPNTLARTSRAAALHLRKFQSDSEPSSASAPPSSSSSDSPPPDMLLSPAPAVCHNMITSCSDISIKPQNITKSADFPRTWRKNIVTLYESNTVNTLPQNKFWAYVAYSFFTILYLCFYRFTTESKGLLNKKLTYYNTIIRI